MLFHFESVKLISSYILLVGLAAAFAILKEITNVGNCRNLKYKKKLN